MLRKSSSTLLTLTVSCFLLWGCASEEQNGVSIDRTPATIPADAVVITAANASAITIELQKITKAIRAASNAASKTCAPTGTITLAFLKTINPANGTISFASCKEGNVTTSGALGFDINYYNNNNIDYQLASYGALSIIDDGDDYKIFGIQFAETGENISPKPFPYHRTTAFAVTLNAAIGGGVLVTTGADIYGASDKCPYAGTLTVAGASNSKMIITIGLGQIKIEVDTDTTNNSEGYVEIQGSPFSTPSSSYCF